MRADRLLSILLLLQVQRRITAKELATRLEVSERTIHRDMEALGVAGIPVVAERGVGGGWSLVEEYRTNLTGLNEGEIQALFLTNPSRVLADLGLRQASEAAFIKLLAALPSMQRRDAQDIRQRIHIDTASWHSSEENITVLPILQEAIWRDQKLQMRYGREDDLVERVLCPLGLVAKGTIWYLVGLVDEQIRNYRVSRIQAACLLDEHFTRPPAFDLAAHWARSSSDFVARLPRYEVVVRASTTFIEQIYHAGRRIRIAQSEPTADGRVTLHLLFEMEQEACGYLLSFGSQIEIVEPVALREQVVALAQEVLAVYQ